MVSARARPWKALLYLLALSGGAFTAQLTSEGGLPAAWETESDAGVDLQNPPAPAAEAESGRTRRSHASPRPKAPSSDDRATTAQRAREPVPQPGASASPTSSDGAARAAEPLLVASVLPTRVESPAPAEPGARETKLDALEAELSDAERATGAAFKDGMIITGSTPHRLILFTFDDGPDPASTPLLLDRLDEAGIKAVFFLVANRFAGSTPIERRQAAVAREIARRGHIVGGHTLDHAQLPLLDDAGVKHQLIESEKHFARIFGSRPFLLRPPFGAHSQRIDQLLAARRYTTVLWNLGAGDFQVRTAEDVYRTWLKVFERREREFGDRGGIILLHDTHPWSVDAFQMIVSHLLRKNCELLERGEELYDFVDDLSFFYVPRGDAPAEAEAPRLEIAPEVLAERQERLREATARRCKALAVAY